MAEVRNPKFLPIKELVDQLMNPPTSLETWKIRPLTGAFGAELSRGDARTDLEPGQLLALLEEHLVLVLRDQHLSHGEQVALAHSIGEPTPAHPVVPGHPDHPEILELDGAKGGKNARWHTDVTFVSTPPAGSVLVADVVPEWGGDTLWADMRTAYERLSPSLQQLVDGLEAVHRISPLAYWGEPLIRQCRVKTPRSYSTMPPRFRRSCIQLYASTRALARRRCSSILVLQLTSLDTHALKAKTC